MNSLEEWVNTTEAAELTGYSQAHMRILARRGHVRARKVGRDWLIDKASLLAYKQEMETLGTAKHSPWRDDLAQRGRGRRGENGQER